MAEPKPENYSLDLLVDDVLRFAEETGAAPSAVPRDAWRRWDRRQVPANAATVFGWRRVKELAAARAAGEPVEIDIDVSDFDLIPQGQELHSTSTRVDSSGRVQSQSIRTHEERGGPHEIPEGHKLKRMSARVDAEGNYRGGWVISDPIAKTVEEKLEILLESLPERVPARTLETPTPTTELRDDYLAAYVMGDPHVGMHAWAPETLDEHFDLRIAEDMTCAAFDDLMSRGVPASTAVIANLGDYFHTDNTKGITERSGHILDVDSRLGKMVEVGERIMIYAIETALRRHGTVYVYNVRGNHDDVLSLMLSRILSAWYRDEPRVQVSLDPSLFYYHRFGLNLIGLHHGHSKVAKTAADLESLMANDRPKDWGETVHRQWYTGHIHHRSAQVSKDSRGATAEAFRTLAALDAYSASEGYRSRPEMTQILLHERWGEKGRNLITGYELRDQLGLRSA